mgnify:CR=1 FL=1
MKHQRLQKRNIGRFARRAVLSTAVLLFGFFLFPTVTLPAAGSGEVGVSGSEATSDETDLPSMRGGSRERGRAEVPEGYERAVFAGGCFWCMEPPYDEVDGVHAVTTGFAGGDAENPTYRQVVGGSTGHVEAVEVIFDPSQVSYEELLDIFWVNVDPLDDGGQFCDRGSMYRSRIFFEGEEQQRIAEESKRELQESGRFDRDIVTDVRELEAFYPAEEKHQSYYTKNESRYRFYVTSCGRKNRLEEVWG